MRKGTLHIICEMFFCNYNTPSVIVMEINEFAAIKLVLVGTVLLVVDIS